MIEAAHHQRRFRTAAVDTVLDAPDFFSQVKALTCEPRVERDSRRKAFGSYSFSNPWLVNFRVRPFSVTVRTT